MIALLAVLAAAAQDPAPPPSPYRIVRYTPPAGEVVEAGGLAFAGDDDLLVSTRRGRVWWVENALAADPAEARWRLFVEGLHEGLGLSVAGGRIYVVQRGELSELIDHDGDRVCDEVRTISQDWGMSGNYHEFAYGLPIDRDGNFYVSLNLGFWSPEWWHGLARVPSRGWILRIAPDGAATPIASGARSPCGLGMSAAGDLFYTDNQGDWMPSSPIFHVEDGDFFGHPASLRWSEPYLAAGRIPSTTEPPVAVRKPAAAWLPYAWSRSTGNLVEDASGGRFGPFAGQFFVAELTNGMVLRVQMEQVRGQWQGAAFRFLDGVGSVVRVAFSPDGAHLVGGMTNRGWGGLAPGHGLARIDWDGGTPFDIRTASLRQDGFVLELTKPLAGDAAPAPAQIEAELYDYNWWWDYGSPQQRFAPLAVRAVELGAERRTLRLVLDGLEPGRVARITLHGLRAADGEPLLRDTFHYTINQMPEGPLATAQVAKQVAPPAPKADGAAGWLHLTWGDALDRWHANGWRLTDAELDPRDPRKLATTPGSGALVDDRASGDFVSRQEFGDCEFAFRFMLPQGGDSGLYFMDRYELQLADDPGQCCGVVGVKKPRVLDAYRGPGQWHQVTGRFFAPRFDAAGRKTRHARFEQIAIDGTMVVGAAEPEGPTGGGRPGEVALGPLRFQAGAGLACIGDVRIRPLAATGPAGDFAWSALLEGEALAAWTSHDGVRRLRAPAWPPAGGGAHELRLRAAVEGPADAVLLLPRGAAAPLELTLAGAARGGPRLGSLPELPQRAELVPDGVPFDVRLRCEPAGGGSRLVLWLNGALLGSVESPDALGGGELRFELRGAAGALRVERLEARAAGG